MNKDALKRKILELCSEDNHGIWELWWPIGESPKFTKTDIDPFIDVIHELVESRQIQALTETPHGFDSAVLDLDRLRRELDLVISDDLTGDMYWFGKPYSYDVAKRRNLQV